ncbi:MAG: SemiSWEET transporter [Thermodesulfobacteriota bacterium]
MDTVTMLGLLAGILTTSSFIPQVIKIYKTRETKDISLAMFIVLCSGILMWAIYGFYIRSFPVIFANTISFVFAFVIVVFKIKYK